MKKRHIFISLILAGLLLVLPGCIGSGVEGGPDSFITADPTVINSGETSTITAFVMTTAGTPMPDGSLVHFKATTVDGDIHIAEAAETVDGRAVFNLTVTLAVDAPSTEVIITATVADVTLSTTLSVIAVPLPLDVIPDTQTITNPVDNETVVYTISGGTAPYTAFSDNPGLVTVGVVDNNKLTATVEGVPTEDATVTITIYDAAGSSITASLILDVPPLLPLAVTPQTATVFGIANPDNDTSDDVTFFISGGIPDYFVTSNTPGVIAHPDADALEAGITSFTVDPDAVTMETPVILTVRDSVGTITTVTVTVKPVPLDISLSVSNVIGLGNPDIDTADDITFTVTGGEGPYIVTSDNPALTPDGTWSFGAVPQPTTFDPNNVGQTTIVTLTVVDNVGNSASATLTIFPHTTGLVISINKPDVIGLANPDGITTDDITFTVTGGTAPYIISATSMSPPLSENDSFSPSGPWTLTSTGATQVIDPIDCINFVGDPCPVTVTLTVTDDAGAIATTTFEVHP
ncbi:hypothetical protein M1N54_05275 [Thermodesulfovibrionales bacterium]|nr:hypothetical protein [Thermodesulfovibrionales bacterium]